MKVDDVHTLDCVIRGLDGVWVYGSHVTNHAVDPTGGECICSKPLLIVDFCPEYDRIITYYKVACMSAFHVE